MRIGLWGARADRRGLAIQTTEFARHIEPDRVMGVDMGPLSPFVNDWSDYEPLGLTVIERERINRAAALEWCAGLDVVWAAETLYAPWFPEVARSVGARTVVNFNFEFVTHLIASDAVRPDMLVAPTPWRIDEVPGETRVLPFPVDRERLPFRLRTEARTFLHIAGKRAAHDRAGTAALWEALRHVTQPVRVVIRSQDVIRAPMRYASHVDLKVEIGDAPDYWRLYDEGDVLIHPRRYGGQSLPMNEALSCGMPVLMPDAPPQASFLPAEMLLPSWGRRSFPAQPGTITLHDVDARHLARRIDELASEPPLVERLSKVADGLADTLSWETLKPRWLALMEEACAL